MKRSRYSDSQIINILKQVEAGTPVTELIESLGRASIAEEALAISVYCALGAKNFAVGVLLAVNHSGDNSREYCDSVFERYPGC